MQHRNNSSQHKITTEGFSKMSSEEKILKFAEGFTTPEGLPEKDALNYLLTKMEKSKPVKVRKLSSYIRAAAAVFILMVGFYSVSIIFGKESVRTKLAEHKEFVLPDGSDVVLNADSKITWSDKHFNETRELTLRGEAYFDVKKGTQFIITTKNGSVEILGTQLDVFSRKDEFRVSCISGKVRVLANNQEQIILPGEKAELTSSGLVKYVKNDVERSISWVNGVFYFEDKPLVSIFDELERQFDVFVNYTGNKSRHITVSFSNKNLEEALDVICIPMDLSYDIPGNKKIKIFDKK
jgi:ferric-dicitrate binding protein FerR (iron transport regulator)